MSALDRTSPGSSTAPSHPPLLEVRSLKKYFPIRRGFFGRATEHVRAVDDVSLRIGKAETLALVGESGCGKSTLGRVVLGLIQPTEGTVQFQGMYITGLSERDMRSYRRSLQIIFQDPYASLTPHVSAGELVGEPLGNFGVLHGREKSDAIIELFERVGLHQSDTDKFPHEFSGGQRQRVGIARAVATTPELIVCDEPVSALDVSVRAQIINLLIGLQEERNLSYLFISHDLSVVEHISHRVAVMYLGKIVETAPVDIIFDRPLHPYTHALQSAVPVPDLKARRRERIRLRGEVPSSARPPSGCRFHTRCPLAVDRCRVEEPMLSRRGDIEEGHFVACHLR